ncbi:MAG: HAMP domain-containing histidine kinase [Bacteroidales bacterium]|nr:HAMP domain-containing histidine kinase [Clostridium sp.]MCM1202770.1 HAMP domain-containing histidine kinase [Bacteroidales bacterium]
MWIGISILLFVLCIFLLLYRFAIRREIRKLKEELPLTRDLSDNRQLSIALFDKELTNLAAEINHNLDYQKQLKLQAEQSEKRLKQSISDIAHDLRTPLTVIKGNLQMLERGGTLEGKDKRYLHICQEKADMLKNMVDDFFEMSVLESDGTRVELSEVDVTKLLVQFLIDHEAVIKEHSLTPDIRLPEKSIMVPMEEKLFLRMLGNLFNNVLQYAEGSFGLSMEVIKEKERDVCRIAFSNVLPPDSDLDIESLFERTYRGNRARQGSGAGLGLYIVKLLAEKQGAEVFSQKEKAELVIGVCYPLKG